MSSTTIYKGAFGEKPSSRVLQPPGGGSSNIFGCGEGDQAPPRAAVQSPRPVETVAKAADEMKVEGQSAAPSCPETKNATVVDAAKTAPVNTAADSSRQEVQQSSMRRGRNSGFNPITGEPYGPTAAQPAEEKKQNYSIGVRQPPGGASSGLW